MRQVRPARLITFHPIIGFSLVIFFVTLADAIMSYMVPLTIEATLKDAALVGLILSCSSFFGIFINLLVVDKMSHKGFKFFLSKVFLFALIFPLIYLVFPRDIIVFLISMLIWSVYYEFIGYSKYSFVDKFVHIKEHTNAWGTLVTFSSLAYMLGPGIAAFLLYKFAYLPFFAAIGLVAISLFVYLIFEKSLLRKRSDRNVPTVDKRNIFKKLGLIKTLFKRLWMLVLFTTVIILMDVMMWTVGVLYTMKLRETSFLGDWLLVIYGLPALFVGLVTENLKLEMGKKKIAFISASIAGLCVFFMGLNSNIYSTLVFVFLMSTFFGISIILIDATFQDYVSRVNVVENDIVSLLQFSHNLAYSVGPVLLGLSAKYLGYSNTFKVVGVLVILVSILTFAVTPRKIKMPQKEIRREMSELL